MQLKVYSISLDIQADTTTKKGKKSLENSENERKKLTLKDTKKIALIDLIENNNQNLLFKKEYRKAKKNQLQVILIDRSVNFIACNCESELVNNIINFQNRNK